LDSGEIHGGDLRENPQFGTMSNKALDKRFEQTYAFLAKHLPAPARILDMGVNNPLAEFLREKGYDIINTSGKDLDLYFDEVQRKDVSAVTAFEILEHLVAPFTVLREIQADTLIVTVPLRLWFARAYWNEKDPRDRHFHEFESRQFDWLLEKAGWKVEHSEMWISPSYKIGIRPLLRNFTPRYYAVVARRIKP